MFDKHHDKRVKELVRNYEKALKKNENFFFEEQDLDDVIFYFLTELEFEKAMILADEGIERFKYSATFYNHKAEILKEIAQYDEALEVLEQAEVFSPNEMSILLNRVDIYSILERFEEAVELLSASIDEAMGIEKAELYLELADIYEDWEKYEEVILALKSCLAIDQENEEALSRMWFSVELTEDYENSITFHKELIEKAPYNYLAWNNLGHAYKGLKQYEKATEAFEFVMAIDETYESAYIDCADVYYKNKAYQKAIDLYTEVLDFTSLKKEVFYNIGKCYDALSNYTKSREYYKEALIIDPYYARAFYKIGKAFINSDLPKSAIPQLEKAHKLDSKNFEYQVTLAEAYLLTDNHQKALAIYETVLKSNQSNKQIHLNMITILYEVGNIDEALSHIETILDKFDDISDLLYIKVAFLYELERRDEAILVLYDALAYSYETHKFLFELLPSIAFDDEFVEIIKSYAKK